MRVRPFRPDDEEMLRGEHIRAGHECAFPDNISDFLVVVDDEDQPIMAAGTKLVPEVTLICARGGKSHPLVKFKGIVLLHEALRDRLSSGNHTEAFSFVSPSVERGFGRHLVRHFGWRAAWKAFAIRIEKP